ncbi:MAG TPA: hypothetical protein DD471_01560, partial [Planctomycetes bacterium]|nr:hypothetical protein [Planctomycetota bacterium]
MKEDSMHLENTDRPHYRLPAMLLFAVISVAIAGGCEVLLDNEEKSKEAPAAAGKDTKDPVGEAPAKKTDSKKDAKVAQSWPMWGGQTSRNMANSFATGVPSSWDVSSGKNIKWAAPLGSQSYGNPSIADGRVFVGTNNEGKRNPDIAGDKGNVMCFSAADGTLLWQAVHDKLSQGRVNDWPEQGICSSPVIEDGFIYYISNRCELVCADVEGFRDGENDG